MLRLTADVNGKVISTVIIHNRGVWKRDVHRYDAALWDHENPLRSVLGMENIPHYRPAGWKRLASIVLDAADRVRHNGALEEVSNV